MLDKNKIAKKVEDVLNSIDGAKVAEPKPFLLTRINAKLLNKQDNNAWDKILFFISRPVVAIAAVCIVIGFNIFVVANNNTSNNITIEDVQTAITLDDDEDDVAINTLVNDNIEP